MIRAYFHRRHLKRRNMVWLEVTPPARVAKTPEATEQLFSVIHGMHAALSFKDKVQRRLPVMSFEIVSTKSNGIQYLVHVEKARSHAIQKAITAYIPDVKVKEAKVEDVRSDEVLEFRETGHYILPLTLMSAFAQHDPLSYITNAMTKLNDDEKVTIQILISPIRLRETSGLAHKILRNEDILSSARNRNPFWIQRLSKVMLDTLWGAADLASEAYHGSAYGTYTTKSNEQESAHRNQVLKGQKPARTLSPFELEVMESMHRKVTQPLFQVNLRILARGERSKEHINELRAAFGGYSVPLYQSLKAKTRIPVVHRYRHQLIDARLPSLSHRSGLVLSAAEIAGLYHFPSTQISKTDNLVTSLSRTLPAPLSLKQNATLDVILGENIHHNTTTAIGLTEKERERHVYVIGGTGNGKTTMLQYAIVQDMQNGKGVAIIDPHGDMAEALLERVPPERINDVIYFNPDDLDHPFAMNLLELTPGLEGNDLLREKDLITESVISIFRKIFSEDDSGGHRIEYVLRNAIHTALTVEDATLFTVLKLLQNATYRRDITNKLKDEDLKDFWKNELGKAGDMQKVKMSAGITAKIGRFNVNAAAKAILGEPKSTIDFEEIMNGKKILICNLSKGILGEDVSELFGITVLAKLQLASLRRAKVKQAQRTPYYLYVDEFQNFATPSFVQMLSESRKYKLFLTMAEQSTSQQDDQQMVSIILANVGTVICFRTGNPNDERLLLPLFSPYITEGEIANLNAYNFYARLSSVIAQEPFSGVTLLLSDVTDDTIVGRVISTSREQYAQKPKPNPKKVSQKNESSKKTNKGRKKDAAAPETKTPTPGVVVLGGR